MGKEPAGVPVAIGTACSYSAAAQVVLLQSLNQANRQAQCHWQCQCRRAAAIRLAAQLQLRRHGETGPRFDSEPELRRRQVLTQ